MDDCVFCKIIKGELPSEVVYEDDNFLAIKDIEPVGEGHTLVIPKKHFSNLLDLEGEFKDKYIEAIQNTGKILIDTYKADGFNVVLNNGKAAGQVVDHVHFHLLPRHEGDNKRGIFIG